ncbi:hypothetical protein B0H16DRAFT_1529053 [Mycena metata]|uniref:Uncharacterized protein n=1 Tax=Mycena metata TaxID=1033252 RepID=A0AAD7JDN8_9AGAR|nr:hypothetical protein B0H16DRAFT_1529053 [Mycena metata]
MENNEREIRDLIRQANASSEKSGALRRKTLNKLIDLTHTSHTALKILAAKNIPDLFNDFPDEEEAAINAVYDLCEDQSPTVRMEGYVAITAISKAANKWVKRNTDVLLQLLQSDEPDEVVVVKTALIAHLDLDARVTLGVLCDQIMPAEPTADPDELYMRDRLRTLVLAFLTGEAKDAIVKRHALPDSGAEDVLVEGLLAAIPILAPADTDIIVKQLLLSLRSYRPGSLRSNALLVTLSDKAQLCLKANPKSLASTRFYLDLMAYVAIEKSLAPATSLLRFYVPSVVGKAVLQRFSLDDQLFVVCHVAEALAASGTQNHNLPQEHIALLHQTSEASPILFECLAKSGISHERSRNACKVLLDCSLRRKAEGWELPSHFRPPLDALRDKSGQFQDVQNLIRSLAAENPSSNGTNPPMAGPSSLQMPTAQVAPPVGRRPGLGPAPSSRHSLMSLQSRDHPVASASGSRSSSHERSINKHSLSADHSPRPLKRVRTDPDQPPSLLSRLASKGSNHPNVTRGRAAQEIPKSAVAVQNDEKPPQSGYSIKGAASRASPSESSRALSSSLLDRLVMDDHGGGRKNAGGKRRNAR